METYDFVVIGAGIAGASAAYELAAYGCVLVLERERLPGYHSTGRSAAVFTENYGNAVVRRLTVASRPFFAHPPDGFAATPLISPRGMLWVAHAAQHAVLMTALAEARRLVPSIHTVDSATALTLCPALRADYLAAAVFEPEAMDLDVHAVHHGFLRGLARRGGEVQTEAEVTHLGRQGDCWEIHSTAGRCQAGVVVNAAGAWCDVIARLAGAQGVGLVPKRRTAFLFDGPTEARLSRWPVVIDVEERFYFKPESGRILASPADETPVPPCDVYPEEYDIAVAVDRIERATTLHITHIRRKWAGLRSFVADKTPVVGMDPARPGFFWLAGQGGYGIMTAPAMARAAAALLVDRRLPADLAAAGVTPADLSPARLQHRCGGR